MVLKVYTIARICIVEVLAVFIDKSIRFKKVESLSFMEDFIETIFFMEIELPREININVCVVYRRPKFRLSKFLSILFRYIEKSFGTKTIICDNFNLDLFQYQSSNEVDTFVDLSLENNFTSLINKPTRITRNFPTVIGSFCHFRANF